MDVTSMLNASSEAEPLRVVDATSASSGNRTPWDAGGYSLPIHSHYNGPFTIPSPLQEPPWETNSGHFRHKLSDSHSSLSSLASSNTASHSRLSSISTISSPYQLNHVATDYISIGPEIDSHPWKAFTSSLSPTSPFSSRPKPYGPSLLTDYVNSLTLVAEHSVDECSQEEVMDQPVLSPKMIGGSSIVVGKGKPNDPSTNSQRPRSPSDAILFKQNASSIAQNISEVSDLVVTESFERHQQTSIQDFVFHTPEQQADRLSIDTKGHKRAVSAPDFPGAVAGSSQDEQRLTISPGPAAELTPPSSRHPSNAPRSNSVFFDAPSTPPEASPHVDGEPCCLYIGDCDTFSVLRKAVSHIFGRNKMCTRQIPPHVWVWYCRKHYQRARYRNSIEWARTSQYDLVSRQIMNLEDWSKENRRTGKGGVVKDYLLAVRKREQKRLEAQQSKTEQELSHTESEGDESHSEVPSSTAVPKWLLEKSGSSYDKVGVLEIIDGIKGDLASGSLSVWPDIEILPNIVPGENEAGPTKGPLKRKASIKTHRRSQSLGAALKSGAHPDGRQINQQSTLPSRANGLSEIPTQKRKRVDDGDDDYQARNNLVDRKMRESGRTNTVDSHGQQIINRRTFQGVSHLPSRERNLSKVSLVGSHQAFAAGVHNESLPAPKPRRFTSNSAAKNLDSSISGVESLSPKSQDLVYNSFPSETDTLFNIQPPNYPSMRHENPFAVYEPGNPGPRRYSSPPGPHSSITQAEAAEQPPPIHVRHQSTPTCSSSISPRDASPQVCRPMPTISVPLTAARGPPTIEPPKNTFLNGQRQ